MNYDYRQASRSSWYDRLKAVRSVFILDTLKALKKGSSVTATKVTSLGAEFTLNKATYHLFFTGDEDLVVEGPGGRIRVPGLMGRNPESVAAYLARALRT